MIVLAFKTVEIMQTEKFRQFYLVFLQTARMIVLLERTIVLFF